MRIGLLGGTFDPVHIGHLVLAQEAWFQLKLDRVLFVPAYIPPHKQIASSVQPADRLNMLRLALSPAPQFGISTHELDKKERCYTIDTVRELKKKYGDEICFISGADAAGTLHEWKDIDLLLEEVEFVIGSRAGYDISGPYAKRITHLTIPELEISSSELRKRISQSRPVANLMPREVLDYIRDKGLYKQQEL